MPTLFKFSSGTHQVSYISMMSPISVWLKIKKDTIYQQYRCTAVPPGVRLLLEMKNSGVIKQGQQDKASQAHTYSVIGLNGCLL